jgi:hypothetical protein
MEWTNFYAFARAMKEAPKVVRIRKAFDLADPAKPLRKDLSQITAMASPIRQHPLLMGYQLARFPEIQAFVENEEHKEWLRDLNEVGGALTAAIEFIRSRIPGYPSFRVPHVRTGSPYTYSEIFFVAGFPWDGELRRMGLQLQGPPPVGPILESQADFAALLNAAADELNASEASASFVDARAAMQPADWDQLREIGRTFAGSVTDDAVTAAAGEFLLQRFQYRAAVLQRLVSGTDGRARAYMDAFEALNELLNVGAALIETTVVSAGLPSVRPTQLVLGSGGELRSAYFVTLDADPFLHPGSIVHLDGPVVSVTGFVYTRAITYDWKRVGDAEVHKLIVRGDFARG